MLETQEKSPDSQAGAGGSSTQSQSNICDSAQPVYQKYPIEASHLNYLVKYTIKQIEAASTANIDLMSSALLTLRQVRGFLDVVDINKAVERRLGNTSESTNGHS